MAIGLVALSQMQTEWQFFVIYALGRGTASGLIGLAAGVTVSKWFVRKRGLAIGVMSLGTRLGFAVMPLMVQLIIQSSGWRNAAMALAVLVATFGILPALKWLHPRPEAFGLLPDGDDAPTTKDSPPPPVEYSWSRHDALRTRAFWLVTFAVSLHVAWPAGRSTCTRSRTWSTAGSRRRRRR